jgi:hypothetical protein
MLAPIELFIFHIGIAAFTLEVAASVELRLSGPQIIEAYVTVIYILYIMLSIICGVVISVHHWNCEGRTFSLSE